MVILSSHSIECNLMVMGEERNGCNCGAGQVWGGCSHQISAQVQKRWAQFKAMPPRADGGICECCGGPALIGEIRETVISWLDNEGNHESSLVEIAQEPIICSRCKEG